MEEAAELGSLDGTVAASPHSDIETAHIRDRAQLVESELALSCLAAQCGLDSWML